MLGKKPLYLLCVILFGSICALLGAYYGEYKLEKSIQENYYLDRAVEMKVSLNILAALREKRYLKAVEYQEQWVDNNLIILSNYPQQATGRHRQAISEILSQIRTYRSKYQRTKTDESVAKAIERALEIPTKRGRTDDIRGQTEPPP